MDGKVYGIWVSISHFCAVKEPLLRVDEYIDSKQLIEEKDTLLVAVSGGLDSMFLLHYLVGKNHKLGVAHCNFGLRGDESDGDELLVKSYCDTAGIKFHCKKFETQLVASSQGISIQMAARNLRYQWFNELCKTENYTKIVTAHHKTDNAETILLNMVRGTGLKGLEGISCKSENKIRPLLCLSRTEIEFLVKELHIPYREDSSNLSDKYYRNRLRHQVLPQLKAINPVVEDTFKDNAEIIRQAGSFIHHFIESIKKDIVKEELNTLTLDVNGLLKCPEPQFVLYTLLSDFGFNAATVNGIFNSLNGLSGKQFFSASHRLIHNRESLIIEPIHPGSFQLFVVTPDTKTIDTPHYLWNFEILSGEHQLSGMAKEAHFDFEKITFPLTVRPWQNGDKIKPLGMKGHKKVSDILIDKKLSLFDKDRIWVVISDNTIVWVSGLVVNDDYKMNQDTRKVLRIRLDEKNSAQ